MSNTAADFYSADNIPSSNWMKFDTVGNSIKGTFKEQFFKEGSWVMPDQEVFTLVNAEKSELKVDAEGNITGVESSEKIEGEINVAVKASNSFILTRLKNVAPWDVIGFAFTKEIAPKQKGYNPAKSIMVFKSWTDEEFLKTYKEPKGWDDISVEDIPF